MGDSGHGSPAHPSLASSRRKVEMIKQVKDKNKVVVVEVGEIVTLVEQCEAKTGDKEPKFLIKKKDGHKLFFKGSNINSSTVGHVALVVEVAPNTLKFIHSANGGVRIENFVTSKYYIQRYIKAKRLDYGGN